MPKKKFKTQTDWLRVHGRRCAGFSLIEILIAVSILALVAVVGIPNLKKLSSDQDVQDATVDIVRITRKVQSYSQSDRRCLDSSGNASRSSGWTITIPSPNPSGPIQLSTSPSCPDISASPSPVIDQLSQYKKIQIDRIKLSTTGTTCTTNGSPPTLYYPMKITFNNLDSSISFSDSPISPNPTCITSGMNKLEIYLRSTSSSDISGIIIDKGGAVYQCPLDSSNNCL